MGQADGRAQGDKPGRPHDHPRVPLHAWAKPTAELKAISQGDRTAIPTTELKASGQGGCSSQATGETVASKCDVHDKANREVGVHGPNPHPG